MLERIDLGMQVDRPRLRKLLQGVAKKEVERSGQELIGDLDPWESFLLTTAWRDFGDQAFTIKQFDPPLFEAKHRGKMSDEEKAREIYNLEDKGYVERVGDELPTKFRISKKHFNL